MTKSQATIARMLILSLPIILTATLPGCFTSAVWNHMGAKPWQRTIVSKQEIPTQLTVQINPDDYSMLLIDSGGPGVSDLEVYQQFQWPYGAELLARPDLFRVEHASITGAYTTMQGQQESANARMILKGRIVADAWHSKITRADVPTNVLARLDHGEMPSENSLPEELQLCAHYLRSAPWSLLRPGTGAGTIVTAYVFQASDGQVIRPDTSQTAPPKYVMRSPRMRAALRATTLYARVFDGSDRQLLRIAPEAFLAVALLRADHADSALAVHKSRWLIRPAKTADAANRRRPMQTATVTADIFRGVIEPTKTATFTLLAQVALTPLAVASDVVLSPIIYAGMWLFGPTI